MPDHTLFHSLVVFHMIGYFLQQVAVTCVFGNQAYARFTHKCGLELDYECASMCRQKSQFVYDAVLFVMIQSIYVYLLQSVHFVGKSVYYAIYSTKGSLPNKFFNFEIVEIVHSIVCFFEVPRGRCECAPSDFFE